MATPAPRSKVLLEMDLNIRIPGPKYIELWLPAGQRKPGLRPLPDVIISQKVDNVIRTQVSLE
jgi:hypothetical protein